jgi:hypothetical protein
MASNAGVQEGESHIRSQGQRNVESCHVSSGPLANYRHMVQTSKIPLNECFSNDIAANVVSFSVNRRS